MTKPGARCDSARVIPRKRRSNRADRGVPRRVTFDVSDFSPIFSPDGRRIAHEANGNRERTLVYERRSDGTGGEAVLLAEPEDEFHNPSDWSLDGQYLLFHVATTTESDLRALPLFGERKPFDVARTPFAESNGRFSPDGNAWWSRFGTEWLPNISILMARPL